MKTLREADPTSYVIATITVCLACADRDCHTCYGEGCECGCRGERTE